MLRWPLALLSKVFPQRYEELETCKILRGQQNAKSKNPLICRHGRHYYFSGQNHESPQVLLIADEGVGVVKPLEVSDEASARLASPGTFIATSTLIVWDGKPSTTVKYPPRVVAGVVSKAEAERGNGDFDHFSILHDHSPRRRSRLVRMSWKLALPMLTYQHPASSRSSSPALSVRSTRRIPRAKKTNAEIRWDARCAYEIPPEPHRASNIMTCHAILCDGVGKLDVAVSNSGRSSPASSLGTITDQRGDRIRLRNLASSAK